MDLNGFCTGHLTLLGTYTDILQDQVIVSFMTMYVCMYVYFSQIHSVRPLRAGEHETFRVKQSDLKKILVVSI